jgi:predicted RNA binding protein YcfA (HicA-like mRNA interferase family)
MRLLLVMPKIAPIKRKDLIKYFRKLGFDGPFSGGNHEFLQKDNLKIWIPNPHKGDINRILLLKILKQANIERDVWEDL